MTLRGKVAIAGIGEVPTRREYPGRSMWSLCVEAARLAIQDSGLRKEDIDGLITTGGDAGGGVVYPQEMAEVLGLKLKWASGVDMMGASTGAGTAIAAAVINAGIANNILMVFGAGREPGAPFGGVPPASPLTEWEIPFGPAAGANTGYGIMYRRHMYEYGTTEEQLAHMSVNQRFNALTWENAAFRGQAITHEDVMRSRYINYPLKLLESVMPCGGAAACVFTTAEGAKSLPNPRVSILGVGVGLFPHTWWLSERELTTTGTSIGAPRALAMAGYKGADMQFAEFYD